jgi:hypothetical protein
MVRDVCPKRRRTATKCARRATVAALVAVSLGTTAAWASSFAWRVVGSARASGDFAVASASGTANHPFQLAVRVTNSHGGSVNGFGVVSCSKGYGIGSKSAHYSGRSPLLRILPMPMPASDSCDVVASGSSMAGGTLVVQILKR